MDLLDILMKAQGGNAVDNLGKQFGLDRDQTTQAVESLAPMVAEGLRRSANTPEGLEALLKALQGGNHQRHYDNADHAALDDAMNDGNGILKHVFGSKDVSRAVAQRASESTGIGSSILKKMLPIIASMVMGSLSKQSREPGIGDLIGAVLNGGQWGRSGAPSGAGGGLLGSILGGLLSGGGQAAQRQSRGQPNLQDIFGDLLGSQSGRSGGGGLDDILRSVEQMTRR